MVLTVHCDGGSRGNPGPAAYGFVVRNENSIIHRQGGYMGITTNNQAEYEAVIQALTYIVSSNLSPTSISFNLDSQLVVNQLNGLFKMKSPALRIKLLKIKQLEQTLNAPVTYTHIYREYNKDADAEVNKALDAAQ